MEQGETMSRILTKVCLVLAVVLTGLVTVGAGPAAADGGSPVGRFDELTSSLPGTINVRGWAFDESAPAAVIPIHVYVIAPGHQEIHVIRTGKARPDVQAVHGVGANSGFSEAIAVRARGQVEVRVYGIDVQAPGGNVLLGTRSVSVGDPDPILQVDSVVSNAHQTVQVEGIAFDPSEYLRPVQVHVYVGGRAGQPGVEGPFVTLADKQREPVITGGFALTFNTQNLWADQPVYVYAVNHGEGVDTVVGPTMVNIKRDTTAPPAPSIVRGPGASASAGTVTFEFTVDEPSPRFQCRWDERGWESCESPVSRPLEAGEHTFDVRAIDRAGLVGPFNRQRFTLTGTTSGQPPGNGGPGDESGPGKPRVKVRAVDRGSKLQVRVTPARNAVSYRFVVQRKVGSTWRRVARSATRGKAEKRVLDLRRGRYRVVLTAQHGLPAQRSATVRLRR